jgi:membrane-bound metal-dependent hydrolase YbcI (DUF457 family)
VQTITHVTIGTMLGAFTFPHQPLLQAACVLASIGPDTVMMPLFALDKLRGKQPLANQGKIVLVLKELSHSLFLSAACLVLGALCKQSIIVAFGFGWFAHIVIDILTHADPKFQAIGDPHYIWPVGSLQKFGIWEYRIETGQLWPLKPFELLVLVFTAALTVAGWIIH